MSAILKPLSRSDLSRFLSDNKSINFFERMFQSIPNDLDGLLGDVDAANLNSSSALAALDSISNSLTELEALANQSLIEAGNANARANSLLDQ